MGDADFDHDMFVAQIIAFSDEMDEHDRQRKAAKSAVPGPSVDVPKGVCPKCGEHVGRGIAFHMKKCLGDVDHD